VLHRDSAGGQALPRLHVDALAESTALRTIERLTWKDKDTVTYGLTIDDPKIFTWAWEQEFEFKVRNDGDKAGSTSTSAKGTIAAPAASAWAIEAVAYSRSSSLTPTFGGL
jgi:hypothetical protein